MRSKYCKKQKNTIGMIFVRIRRICQKTYREFIYLRINGDRFLKALSGLLEISNCLKHTSIQKITVEISGSNIKHAMLLGGKKLNLLRRADDGLRKII